MHEYFFQISNTDYNTNLYLSYGLIRSSNQSSISFTQSSVLFNICSLTLFTISSWILSRNSSFASFVSFIISGSTQHSQFHIQYTRQDELPNQAWLTSFSKNVHFLQNILWQNSNIKSVWTRQLNAWVQLRFGNTGHAKDSYTIFVM